MIGEINIYGVLLPPLLVWLVCGVAASALVRAGLNFLGFYRFVWHRPLFDFSLLVILTGAISWVAETYF
jgi:hypothetical protein